MAMWMQPRSTKSESLSLGAVMFWPAQRSWENNATSAGNIQKYLLHVSSCSLFAGWQPSELFADPTKDRYMHSPGTTDPAQSLSDWMQVANKSTNTVRMVDIDAE